MKTVVALCLFVVCVTGCSDVTSLVPALDLLTENENEWEGDWRLEFIDGQDAFSVLVADDEEFDNVFFRPDESLTETVLAAYNDGTATILHSEGGVNVLFSDNGTFTSQIYRDVNIQHGDIHGTLVFWETHDDGSYFLLDSDYTLDFLGERQKGTWDRIDRLLMLRADNGAEWVFVRHRGQDNRTIHIEEHDGNTVITIED